ncbi:MAG: hypothetical protein Alis3KO_29340 [Aliiglaciecola sp.]
MFKFIILVFVVVQCAAQAQTVKYIDNTDDVDKHGKYFVQLLELAFEKSKEQYGSYNLEPVPVSMRQDRLFKSIETGMIDLMWTVTSKPREKNALAIPIPLLKGLIGHRVLVIERSKLNEFAQIKSIQQLANYTGVQGHDWPDTVILDNAGLKVERIVWHSSMYKLVSSGIIDYFPRSVLEVIEELERAKDPTLVIDPYHLIVYPSAIYYFVNKDKKELAKRIEFGLREAIKDGSFDKLFYSFPGHFKAMRDIPTKDRIVFNIDNPLMPESALLDEQALWIEPIQE